MSAAAPKHIISTELVPLMRRLTRAYNEAMAVFKLKPVEAHILAELKSSGPMTVGRLGAGLGLSGSTLTSAIDRLEDRELLRRELAKADRRSILLTAVAWTPKKEAQFRAVFGEVEDRFFGALSKRERAQLHALLKKLNGETGS